MPTPSLLQFHDAADSDSRVQVGSVPDLDSLPSAPPDIRNWFSSYVYESPELNTLDGLLNVDGFEKTCVEEENTDKFRDIGNTGKFDGHSLAKSTSLPVAKELSNEVVSGRNEADDCACREPTPAMVVSIPDSDSDSFPSEPPDIRNWFSSYVYESPELNTLEGLLNLEGFEKTSIEGEKTDNFGDTSQTGKFKDQSLGTIAKELSNEISGRNIPDDCECTEPTPAEVVHNVEQKTFPIPNSMPLKGVGHQTSPGERESRPVSKSKAVINHDTKGDAEVENCLIDRTDDSRLHMELGKYNWDRQSHKKPVRGNISLEKENLHDAALPKEDSRKAHAIETAKENDGFVSTRKKGRQKFTRNVMPKDGPHLLPNLEKVIKKSRKAFSDESDFHYPHAMESSGRWHCPQKKKPNLGPPLKQIGLERWFRRNV